MNEIAEKYQGSQVGKLTEEIKKAYLAGLHILYVVTKDFDIVREAILREPIFFLTTRPTTKNVGVTMSSLGTKIQENKVVEKQNLFFGMEFLKKPNPNVPSLYVVTAQSQQMGVNTSENLNRYLKDFLDGILGFSPENNANLRKSMVIVVSPSMLDIPEEISIYCRILRVEEPSTDEVQNAIAKLVMDFDNVNLDYKPDKQSYILQLTNLTKGLSLHKISQLFSRIKSELDHVYISTNDRDAFRELENIILEEKSKLIENSAILKLIKTKKSMNKTSGMDGLSSWLQARRQLILKPEDSMAEAFISQPKGVLLAGIPGTGKSLAAKTTSAEFGNLPLLQLDMGNIMDKYQGESEHKMEEALKLAEAMSPCILWIDEIEKGIAGASGGSNGSESMKRIFGKLLTWMQEKEEKGVCCFVFATANSIDNIPPEMFRSGRFDEKFYTFLPSLHECTEIFINQIASQNKAYKNYCKKTGLPIRDLFDNDVMKESFISGILNSHHVLKAKLSTSDKKITRDNKLLTGSDIADIIQRAKLILYNTGKVAKGNTPIYQASAFCDALYAAIDEARTYGQTNAKQIVECYVKLSEYNFRSVSGKEIVPFRFLDLAADENQPLFDLASDEVATYISSLSSEYDRQLFLYMGIGINQFIERKGSNNHETK